MSQLSTLSSATRELFSISFDVHLLHIDDKINNDKIINQWSKMAINIFYKALTITLTFPTLNMEEWKYK